MDLSELWNLLTSAATLVGSVVLAAYGLLVSLKALATGLAKLAEVVTPGWEADETFLRRVAQGLDVASVALDQVADWISTLTLKLEKPNARK